MIKMPVLKTTKKAMPSQRDPWGGRWLLGMLHSSGGGGEAIGVQSAK